MGSDVTVGRYSCFLWLVSGVMRAKMFLVLRHQTWYHTMCSPVSRPQPSIHLYALRKEGVASIMTTKKTIPKDVWEKKMAEVNVNKQ